MSLRMTLRIAAAAFAVTPAASLADDIDRAPWFRGNDTVASLAAPVTGAVAGDLTASDVAVMREVFAAVRRGRLDEATALQGRLADPAARRVAEWFTLRQLGDQATFDRLATFLRQHPTFPQVNAIRRRAEGSLWDDRATTQTIRTFFANQRPITSKGRLSLAGAHLAAGEREAAAALVRETWRNDALSAEVERITLERFGELITRADHKFRMDRRLLAEDEEGATRAAARLGGAQPAIARAFIAVSEKSSRAKRLLDAVPADARRDPAYVFAMAQWLRREERGRDAAATMAQAPRDHALLAAPDEWWLERRALVRRLLDEGHPREAYTVARGHNARGETERMEGEWTAGWIALRFLDDHAGALRHFDAAAKLARTPISKARTLFWLGRAQEAAGNRGAARQSFAGAAQYPFAYYGQIARQRLGQNDLPIRPAPQVSPFERAQFARTDIARTLDILYELGERDLLVSVYGDLVQRMTTPAEFALLADVAARVGDARNLVQIGKAANQRGHAFESIAWPTNAMPRFTPVTPVELAVVYAIARQESEFNQRTVSSANAMGLMQVTPVAGRHVAKRFGITYDQRKLMEDPVYNTTVGAAEIADNLATYGSYVLAFAAYNAGSGRVRDWLARYGDPRDPSIDPIDWIERIPFQETRNYVQRVMENLQVYRARFSESARNTIEQDLRRVARAN